MGFPFSPITDSGERAAAIAYVEAMCADIKDLSEHIQGHDDIDWRDKNFMLGPCVAMRGWCEDMKNNIEKVFLEE